MALAVTNPFTTANGDSTNSPALVFSRTKTGSVGSSVQLVVDAAVQETHSGDNTITDHPVEQGADISDHSRPNPDKVSIEAVISNTPLSPAQSLRAIRSGSVSFQSASQQSVEIGQAEGYAQQAYRTLTSYRKKGVLVTVVTSLRTYSDMAIESLSVPRTAKNSDALYFTINFKSIRLVQNKLTTTTVAAAKNVGKKVKKGAQTPQATDTVYETPLSKQVNGLAALAGFGK